MSSAHPRRCLQWFVSSRWSRADDMKALRAVFSRTVVVRLVLVTALLVAGLHFGTTRYYPEIAAEVRWPELTGCLIVCLAFMAAVIYGLTWIPRLVNVNASEILIQRGQAAQHIPWQLVRAVSIETGKDGRRVLLVERIDRRSPPVFLPISDRISDADFADFLRHVGRASLFASHAEDVESESRAENAKNELPR